MLLETKEFENTARAAEEGTRLVGEGVKFQRIRRITGYLVGSIERFNNAKRAEEHDRVKHGTAGLEDVPSFSFPS